MVSEITLYSTFNKNILAWMLSGATLPDRFFLYNFGILKIGVEERMLYLLSWNKRADIRVAVHARSSPG